MTGSKPLRAVWLLLAWGTFSASQLFAAEPTQADLDFFEKRIRPLFVEHCYSCHGGGEKRTKGGLRLDVREGWSVGGDSGPAIEPGKPDESLLILAVRYGEGLDMPPRGKLPDSAIKDLEHWVERGAADPRIGSPISKPKGVAAQAADHWAYQPIRNPAPPAVDESAWPQNDIDRFILARLEERHLRHAGDADRPALVRRLYYDLIGLPPRPEEIDALMADSWPEAYERLVDRLLASPQFAERWGRHWLDIVRYAESMTLRGLVFHEAWRYRDYVIEAFNQDRPLDDFIREQIAGDLLPAASVEVRRRNRIATAFLAMGNANLEDQDKVQLRMDVVDEQLDTIGKAFMAQTIGCARCHDHKFDPIPTRDYYAMAGILRSTHTLEHANVSNWIESPLPLFPEEERIVQEHAQAVAACEASIKALGAASRGAVAANSLAGVVVDDAGAKAVGQWQRSQFAPSYVGDGYVHDQNDQKGKKSLTFLPQIERAGAYEVRLSYTTGGNRATNVPVTIFSADGQKTLHVNERQSPPINGMFVSLGEYRFEPNGQGYVIVSNENTDGHVIADAVQFIACDQTESGANENGDKLASAAGAQDERQQARAELKRLEQELKRLKASSPAPKAMTVSEEKEIGDTHIHIRGSVHNLGPEVPRGFLQAAGGPTPSFSTEESGRRELADWLVRRDHPLTSRVLVNRIWHWLLGAGLVRTTDNFGTTGEAPSHPELLDYLATRFMNDGWSAKSLIRQIVLSRTYRQSTVGDKQTAAADPENRWLARAPRRRLDAECLRDAMLAICGELDLQVGGETIKTGTKADYGYSHDDDRRRSVYTPAFRNSLPELFKAFDFADTSVTTGVRNRSTTPQQALFFMNDPFVRRCAERAAERTLAMAELDDEAKLTIAFRTAVGRPPEEAELKHSLAFLAAERRTGEESREAWTRLWQTLFGSLDFRYLD
jgi:hypothetical protein